MSFRVISDDIYLNNSKTEDACEDRDFHNTNKSDKNGKVYFSENKIMSNDEENTVIDNNNDDLSEDPELESELYSLWVDALY